MVRTAISVLFVLYGVLVTCTACRVEGFEKRTIPGSSELPEIVYSLPGGLEDASRLVVMSLAGVTLGMLFLLAQQFSKLTIDRRDRLTYPLGGLSIAFFLLTLFVGLEIASRLRLEYITWRTPLAALAYIISTFSLSVLLIRTRKVVRRANSTHATVRMTLTDTAQPGPDVDLTDGTKVIHDTEPPKPPKP
jgi:hypothetical protein